MSLTGLVAQRFAGNPLRQPKYTMRDVPRTSKDLKHSAIYHTTDRDHLNDSMAEFVLLCNEVMRRKAQKHKNKSSKPLSLEYMADRLDVDDPVFGFIVRTDHMPPDYPVDQQKGYFIKGMCQGFITVTTFTNWQKSFRWDSMHDSAFAYDEPELSAKMASKERIYDQDGTLAEQLQNTVKCGDPWNEGIVWPKIAEISILGALGCGKALVSLVIERLEAMPATSKHSYDYVVLQATDNSKSFYEYMGFVRVGCVTEQVMTGNGHGTNTSDNNKNSSPKSEIVSSPVITITTQKNGETAKYYAKKYNVDVFDIIFLNHFMYPELTANAYLMKGTTLYIPDTSKFDGCSNAKINGSSEASKNTVTQWYFSEDNETPREIAKKFNVNCKALISANSRIADLKANSKLMEGTRMQVTNLDQPVDKFAPYVHWTFPDHEFESNPDPSYMMAKKLNRKTKSKARIKPVESSFAIEVQNEYDLSSIPTTVVRPPVTPSIPQKTPKKSKKRKRHPDQPLTPKRPKTAYFRFLNSEKERLQSKNLKISMVDLTKVASQHWKVLPQKIKTPFVEETKQHRQKYEEELKAYKSAMKEFKLKHPQFDLDEAHDGGSLQMKKNESKLGYKNLFNKVVKLNKEGKRQAGTEFQYYFVLTYIPDLFWCHLAPMKNVGVFGKNRKKVEGRTKWMLADEGFDELDISASACQVVKSRVMKGCADADKEEWDIIDIDHLQEQNDKSTISAAVSTVKAITAAPLFRDEAHNRHPTEKAMPSSAEEGICKTTNDNDGSATSVTLISKTPCAIPEQISEPESTDEGPHSPLGLEKSIGHLMNKTCVDKVITPIRLGKESVEQSRSSSFQTSLTSFFRN